MFSTESEKKTRNLLREQVNEMPGKRNSFFLKQYLRIFSKRQTSACTKRNLFVRLFYRYIQLSERKECN